MLETQGSEDADYSLICKRKLSKNGSFGWHQEPGELWQKGENMPHCDVTHKEPQTQNEKTIKSKQDDLSNP